MPSASSPQRPNILWICTDQQRADTLGCMGNRLVRTPHLDRLAGEGSLCTSAFAQSPLCMPSRGSFLTGRYPVTNRLRQNGQRCPPDLRPITRDLREAGYVCGLAGKLHLAPCDNRLQLGPEWWREDPKRFFRGSEPRIDDGYDVFLWDHAPSGLNPCSAYTQWVWQKARRRVETPPRPDSPYVLTGMPPGLHQTTFCVEQAISFLELMADQPHPWLFSCNIFDPHPHFDPPAEYLERYLDRLEEIPLPSFEPGELANKPAHQQRIHQRGYNHRLDPPSPRQQRMMRAAYWAMIDQIDFQIGRLLAALEASHQADNTIVIFMSDHGELLGDHGLWPKGPMLYDCSVQVPLLMRWPGRIAAGLRLPALLELTDLAPTLREAVGLPADPAMQGRSFLPLLDGRVAPDFFREDVYSEYLNGNPDQPPVYLTSIRTVTHKLVACHGTGDGELYDLQADPGEHRNLWHDPDALPLKADLLVRLTTRQAHTADPLPERIGVF